MCVLLSTRRHVYDRTRYVLCALVLLSSPNASAPSSFFPLLPSCLTSLSLSLTDFVISTISALLCMAYISRETPAPVEEGKPKPPPPVKATRSPVPCYFRWLQHVSWVLACLSSMVVMSVYWLVIVSTSTKSQTTHRLASSHCAYHINLTTAAAPLCVYIRSYSCCSCCCHITEFVITQGCLLAGALPYPMYEEDSENHTRSLVRRKKSKFNWEARTFPTSHPKKCQRRHPSNEINVQTELPGTAVH